MAAKRPEGEGPMSPVDVIIVVAVVAAFVACVRYLGKSQKNGCSECGGSCSAHGKGDCSAALPAVGAATGGASCLLGDGRRIL